MNKKIILLLASSLFLVFAPSSSTYAQAKVSLTIQPVLAAVITTPEPFSFIPKINVPRNALISSDAITVKGNRVPVPISITGGLYSIDNNAYTNEPGEVREGQEVKVRVWSSYVSGRSKSTALTIGRTSNTFTVTTILPPPTQNCSDGVVTVYWKGSEKSTSWVMWQRCDDGKFYTVEQAIEYCNNLVLDGYDDWELPYWIEMFDLVLCSNGNPSRFYDGGCEEPFTRPTIDPIFQCTPDLYWYGDHAPFPGGGPFFPAIDFSTGAVYQSPTLANIRCVRDVY